VLDLNAEDDTGLPWGFVDEGADLSRIRVGLRFTGSGIEHASLKILGAMAPDSFKDRCRTAQAASSTEVICSRRSATSLRSL
jgi:hypothetical protein